MVVPRLFHFKSEGQPQGSGMLFHRLGPSIFVQAGRYMFNAQSVVSIAVIYIKMTECRYCRLMSIKFISKCEANVLVQVVESL